MAEVMDNALDLSPGLEPLEQRQRQYSAAYLREGAIKCADYYGIPRDLMLGYLGHESNWNPRAKNPRSSARGLGQIIDATGRGLGLTITGGDDDDRWNPDLNMDAIGREMKRLYEKTGDWKRVLLSIGEPHEGYYNLVKRRAELEAGLKPGERLPGIAPRQDSLLQVAKDYLGYLDLPEFLPAYNRDKGQWEPKTVFEARRLFHGWDEHTEVERVLGRGLSGLSLGWSDVMMKDITGKVSKPETFAGAAAGAALQFGGFMQVPIKMAGMITGSRMAPTREGLRDLAQLMAQGGATLGVATAISAAIPSLMESENLTDAGLALAKGTAMSGLVGALFPVLGTGGAKGLSKAVRLAGGFAVLDYLRAPKGEFSTVDDVVQGVYQGKIPPADLAHKVFDYLVDLYFLNKTPTMMKSLEGLKVNALMAEAARVNPEEAERDIIAIGKSRGLDPEVLDQLWKGRRLAPGLEEKISRGEPISEAELRQAAAHREALQQETERIQGEIEGLVDRGEAVPAHLLSRRRSLNDLVQRLTAAEAEPEARGPEEAEGTAVKLGTEREGWKRPWELSVEEYIARVRGLEQMRENEREPGEVLPKLKSDEQLIKQWQRQVQAARKRGEPVPEKWNLKKQDAEEEIRRLETAEPVQGEAPAPAKEPWEMTRDEFAATGPHDTNAYIRKKTGAKNPKQLLKYYQDKYPELRGVTIGGLSAPKGAEPYSNEGAVRIILDNGQFVAKESQIHLTKDADLTVTRHEIEHLLDIIHGRKLKTYTTKTGRVMGEAAFNRFRHDEFGKSDYLHRGLLKDALSEGKLTPDRYNELHAADYGEWGSEQQLGLINPDPVVGPDGQLKMYSGGPDTAELAKGLLSRESRIARAAEAGNLATIVREYGGFNPSARIIKENFAPEEQRRIRLFSRRGAQGPDALLAELKGSFPDLFHYETDADFLRAIADNSIYKKINLDKLEKEEAEYYARIEAKARDEGFTAEGLARIEADVAREISAERDHNESQGSTGERYEPWSLTGGQLKPSDFQTRLEVLQDEYPDIDLKKAAVVLRAFPNAEHGQVAAMSADPKLFNQVGKGNLAASEREQLYRDATDVGKQMGLPGMEESAGDLFKMYSGGPAAGEVAEAVRQVARAGSRLIDWFDKRLERRLPAELQDRDAGKNLGVLLMKIQNFEDISRTYPEAKPVFEAARAGLALKTRHAQEFYSLIAPYLQLNPAERAGTDKVLFNLDRLNPETWGLEFRLNSLEAFESYLANPMEEVRAKGVAAYMDLSGGLEDLRFGTTGKLPEVTERMAEGAFGVRMALDYAKHLMMDWQTMSFREWLEAQGFEAGKIRDLVDMLVHGEVPVENLAAGFFGPEAPKKVLAIMENFREHIQYWAKETHQYVPHSRYGEYFIRVIDKATGEVVHATAAESRTQFHEKHQALKGEFPEELYKIKFKLEKRMPMEIFAETHIPRVWRIVSEAGESRKMPAEAKEAMMEAWQDFLAAKGFGAHYIRRMNTPGYETDLLRPIADYLGGLAGYIGKMEKIRGFSKAFLKIPTEMPNLFRELNEYSNYVLSNPKEFEGFRNLIFHWALGGNLSFHFINALQNLNTGWAVLGQATTRPIREMAGAYKDWTRYMTTGEGLRETEETVLARARMEPELAPSGVGELSGRAYNPLYRWLHNDPTSRANRAMDVVREIWSGSMVERVNRETFFLSAYRATGEFDRAIELTRQAHFLYGKETRPGLARGAGSLPFIFMTYSVNYFTLLKNFGKAAWGVNPEVYGNRWEGAKGLSRMFAGMMVTGGLMGSFLGPIVKAAYQKVFGRDMEDDGKKYLAEDMNLGQGPADFGVRLAFRGLPAAALGIDISSRVAPNLPFMNLPPGELHYQDLIAAALGAATMPLQKAWQAGRALAEGDTARAVEYAAPVSMQNLLAAVRLRREGATTLGGRPIFTKEGEQLRLTPGEIARKAAGFQPVRLAEHWTRARLGKELERDRKDKVHDISGALARAIRTDDDTEFNRIIDQWVNYNNKMIEAGRYADVISDKAVESAVQRRFQPVYPDGSQKQTLLRELGLE